MIKLIQKILYAFIACGMVLGFFPVVSKEKQPEYMPETPEVNATEEATKKKPEEPTENEDDFDLEEEEERLEEMMPQPKRRKEREGEPE